jgi:DNA-binding MarR family transcriptional regulator
MTETTPTDVLETAARLRLATARLARQLRQQAGGGLSPSQQSALASIDGHGPLTLGTLARVEQVAPPTITKVVVKLEEDGLVGRQVDGTDRRVVRVEITPAGRRRLAHARSRRNAWLARRLRTLHADDPTALRHLEAALPLLEALAAAPDAVDAVNGGETDRSADPSATALADGPDAAAPRRGTSRPAVKHGGATEEEGAAPAAVTPR